VIGMLVDWEDHLARVLNQQLGKDYEVYSLGTDMGTLIQYTQVTDFAVDNFDPDILIYILNSGDVESSVLNYGDFFPSNIKIQYDNGIFEEVAGTKYIPNKIKRKTRNSALIRYLWINRILQLLKVGKVDINANPDNQITTISEDKTEILHQAADYCIAKMSDKYPDKDFLFVVDAYRYGLYKDPNNPIYLPVSDYLKTACKNNNTNYLDLTEMFYSDYRSNEHKFNWDHDYHWNPYAHKLVANSLYEYLMNNILLDN